MVALRVLKRSIGLVSTIILARLLVPEDFGIVAMATALMTFVVMFSELGVETVLVRKTTVDDVDLNSAWSLQVTLGLFQAFALLALAWPMAGFFEEPRLEPVVCVLAVGVFIHGFRNIGTVAFRREMTFSKDFLLEGAKKGTAFLVTVPLAIIFHSYWALVAGIVAARLSHVALSYIMHPFRPRWSRARWKEIFGFSKWLLANSGLQFLTEKGPIFVLGRVSGAQGAGVFNIAQEIAMFATRELVTPINRAILPGYARMKENPEQLKRGYLDVLGMVALVLVPAGLGLAVTAELLVPVALGSNWMDAVPLVERLACAGAVMGVLANAPSVFLALGRPWLVTALGAVRNVVLIPSMIAGGILVGAEGVAWALLATSLVMVPVNLGLVARTLTVGLMEIGGRLVRPLVGAGTMALTLKLALVPFLTQNTGANLAVATVLSVLAGAFIYFAIVGLLWWIFGGTSSSESQLARLAEEKFPVVRRSLALIGLPSGK